MAAIVMPPDSFATLAFELRVYANREVGSNQQVEVFLASLPGGPTADQRQLVANLQSSAAMVGRAAMLLSLLAPHEAAVRALVTGDQTGDVDEMIDPTPSAGGRHACLARS